MKFIFFTRYIYMFMFLCLDGSCKGMENALSQVHNAAF